MVFCGQCGLHLPAGVTRCPRCGTLSTATSNEGGEHYSSDAPTVESLSYMQAQQTDEDSDEAYSSAVAEPYSQHRLILHPENNTTHGYNPAMDNEPTSAMAQANYRSYTQTPGNPPANSPFATAPSRTLTDSVFSNNAYPQTHATPVMFTSTLPPEKANPFNVTPTPPVRTQKSRILPMLLALLVLLIVLGVSATFLISYLHSKQGTTGGGTTTPITTSVGAAKQVVRDYYNEVNNKEYQSAYNRWQWGTNAPTYTTFKNGYANTLHDELTIQNATQLSDGTVKVMMTIVATERTSNSTRQRTYSGYYIVGQYNGTWKILRGILNPV